MLCGGGIAEEMKGIAPLDKRTKVQEITQFYLDLFTLAYNYSTLDYSCHILCCRVCKTDVKRLMYTR